MPDCSSGTNVLIVPNGIELRSLKTVLLFNFSTCNKVDLNVGITGEISLCLAIESLRKSPTEFWI